MGTLTLNKNGEQHYFLYRYITHEDEGIFKFKLQKPLILTGNQRIIIKQSVLPKIKVKFPSSKVVMDENPGLYIPSFYISSPSQVVEKINQYLQQQILEFHPSEMYDSKAIVKVKLLSQQSLRVSTNIADLLFEGKTLLVNKTSSPVIYEFTTKKEYEEDTYFLTCNLADKTRVGNMELPLINTLVVQYHQGENQSHLLWSTEETQGKSYTKRGIYRTVELGIRDREGEPVKLKGGVLFIHFKVCI